MNDSWKLDENGNVIETTGSYLEALHKFNKSIKCETTSKPKTRIDHYALCKSCFHYSACVELDYEDHMCDMTEADCAQYISVMTPEKFAEEMRELSEECSHGDPELAHVRMDELMCKVLKTLGYGEGVDIFDNAHKWYA